MRINEQKRKMIQVIQYTTGKWLRVGETGASLVVQLVKNPLAVQETWVWSLGWEDHLERGKATHSSILAWTIPWTVIVHGITKSQTQQSDFHFQRRLRVGESFWASLWFLFCWDVWFATDSYEGALRASAHSIQRISYSRLVGRWRDITAWKMEEVEDKNLAWWAQSEPKFLPGEISASQDASVASTHKMITEI